MTIFFSSDTHFGHSNIIKLANRPFASVEEMDEKMIANWNAKVKPDDVVYHLGDFSYRAGDPRKYFDRLNGTKHLVEGNHDNHKTFDLPWRTIRQYVRLDIDDLKIVLFHFPIWEWDQYYRDSIHLHGHVHGNNPHPNPRAIDLSPENPWMNYSPISLDEVKELIKNGR